MGTCNFSKVNARRYYVVNNETYYNEAEDCYQSEPIDGQEPEFMDWDEVICDIQELAKGRQDGKLFSPANEAERSWNSHRDEGTVILFYDLGGVNISKNYTLDRKGSIILRPGYYAAAVLDWDFEIMGYGDSWNMNDWESIEDIAEDIMNDWRANEDGWNEGIKAIQARRIQAKIDKALNETAERLEEICADLCGGNVYAVSARFSNGETFYTRVDTPKGAILAALA